MRSVFILNAGSSSVKASLLLLAEGEDEKSDWEQSPIKPPIRLVTALAERLGTKDSVMHMTLSVSAAKAAFADEHPNKKALIRSNSLHLTSRSTVDHHESEECHCDETEKKNVKLEEPFLSHQRAVELILEEMNSFDSKLLSSVIAVGHRVVHGGATFVSSVIITDSVLNAIQNVSHLAPLYVLHCMLRFSITCWFADSHSTFIF
jgi:acetate kinase